MYCSECGKPATGKFCSNCGTPLAAAAGPAVALAIASFPAAVPSVGLPSVPPAPHLPLTAAMAAATPPAATPQVVNWEQEWRYEELMKVPEVRQIIERHASMAHGNQRRAILQVRRQNPTESDPLG